MTIELENKLADIERQLTERPKRSLFKKALLGTLALLIVAVASISLAVWEPWQPSSQSLPPEIVAQADFPVYYFAQGIPPLDYRLDTKTVSYSRGVLSYIIRTGSRVITVTQQKQPPDLDAGLYAKAETVSGADGAAILTFNGTRGTGALFSKARNGTSSLVFLNGNDKVQAEDIKQLLRSLRLATNE